MRGATGGSQDRHRHAGHFNPRTPCGVRHSQRRRLLRHAHFNPRTPCGVRPGAGDESVENEGISIHAPHAGCDRRLPCAKSYSPHFNPRTPCGVRHKHRAQVAENELFQSTHPMRGATRMVCSRPRCKTISIHAPHAGCDRGHPSRPPRGIHFNPRTPCGVRPRRDVDCELRQIISIHAPHAGCDIVCLRCF